MTDTQMHPSGPGQPSLVGRAIQLEAGIWRSLYRWVTRRPVIDDATEAPFGYVQIQAAVMWAFIGVSALEIPVLHLILPWKVAEIIAVVIGVWGLLWALGYMASLRTRPHVVGPAGLRVRHGVTVDTPIGWDDVAGIRVRRRNLPTSKTVQLADEGDGTILSIGVSGQTNVDVILHRTVTASLPKGDQTVAAVRIYADDAQDLVALARQYLATAT